MENLKIPEETGTVIKLLEESGFEAYIVGGCVRDCLLGREPADFDVTTSAKVEEMVSVLSDYKLKLGGAKHGTVMAIVNGVPVETTTFRVDGAYADHRHPDEVVFTKKLSEDLKRRDFTINAMAYSPITGLVDNHSGTEDLKNRIIRAVGDPQLRFREDALRILRAVRFAAKLDFTIEENTYMAMLDNREALKFVSVERIYKELEGVFSAPDGKALERVLRDYKEIFFEIIPEMRVCDGFPQKNVFHCYDVYNHIVKCVGAVENNFILRLTMYFHDIGKPAAETYGPDGAQHFHGHPELGAEMTDKILQRLRAPNRVRVKTALYVSHHEDFKDIMKNARNDGKMSLAPATGVITGPIIGMFIKKVGSPEDAVELSKILRADLAGKSELAIKWTAPAVDEAAKMIYNYAAEKRVYRTSQLAVKGSELKKIGVPPGELTGKILDELLDEVILEKIDNNKECLLSLAADIKKRLEENAGDSQGGFL